MPRIPLYNRTGTPSQEIGAQSVGPRASIDAFAAPSRAVVQLGQTIGAAGQQYSDQMNRFESKKAQIEFDFAMAEKNAETDRVYRESMMNYARQSQEFRETNQDTSTDGFRKAHDELNDRFVQSVDSRNDLTPNQKRDIKGRLMPTFVAQSTQGSREAFARGQVVRSQVAKESIATMIGDARQLHANHPDRKRLVGEIEAEILRSERDGLNTGYSVQSVRVAFETGDIDTRIRAAATSDQLDEISQDILKSTVLGPNSQATLQNRINTRRNQLSQETYQDLIGDLQALNVNFDDQDLLKKSAKNGDVYVGTNEDGEEVIMDFGAVKPSVRQSFVDTLIPRRFKEIDDNVGQVMVSTIMSNVSGGNSVIDTIEDAASYYGQDFLNRTGKDKSDVDAILVETAQQIQQEAARMVASGPFEQDEVNRMLDSVDALLQQPIVGNDAFVRDAGALGDKANGIANRVATIRGDMSKALADAAQMQSGVDLVNQGRINIQDIGLTDDEKQLAIRSALSERETLAEQINLLSDNDAEFKQWTGLLSAAKNRLMDPSVTEISDDVTSALQIFNAISLQGREGVFDNHIKSKDRVFWNSWKTLTSIHSPEDALSIIKTQRQETDVNLSYEAVADQVNVQGEELYQQGWFTSAWNSLTGGEDVQMPENISHITTVVGNLTKEYIKLGIDPEAALTQASDDFFRTHTNVGNVLLRIPDVQKFPDNLQQMRDVLVDKFLQENPDLTIEPEELSIMNVQGSVDVWRIVRNGGYPVTGTSNLFNLTKARDLVEEANKRAAGEAAAEGLADAKAGIRSATGPSAAEIAKDIDPFTGQPRMP